MNISETFPVLPKMAEERLRLDYSLIVAAFVSAAFFNATSCTEVNPTMLGPSHSPIRGCKQHDT